jgi:hypothetical protein
MYRSSEVLGGIWMGSVRLAIYNSLKKWSWRRGLNPRPSDYKSDALPTELRQLTLSSGHPEIMERETGIEPATNSLEGCDSTTELLPHEVSFAILTHWMALLY